MKIKTMRRDEWLRPIEKEYTYMTLKESNGEAGLLQIKKVNSPLYVFHDNQEKCIADDGYSWLQVARKDSHVWLTAMFNEKDELLECYFDITNKNIILFNGNSSFEDLYLDIVFFPNGQIKLLDEDELEDAYHKNLVTLNQLKLAYKVTKILMDWLSIKINQQTLIDFCNETYFKLKQ